MLRLSHVLRGSTRLVSKDTIGGVPRCDVFEGRWKYVLLEVTGGTLSSGVKDHAVSQCPCEKCDQTPQQCDRSCFHKQLSKPHAQRIEEEGYKVWMDGGGWIEVDTIKKTAHVYGISIALGPAPHHVTAEKLRTSFPDYTVTFEEE